MGDLWSHHSRTDPSTPAEHCTYVGRQGLWQHYQKTTPPFVRDISFFLSVCVCSRICAWMCNYMRLAAGGCQTGLKDTVQYSLYLPWARINAWTEPWQGANISQMIMLYFVDNRGQTFFWQFSPKNEFRKYIYDVIYMYMHYAEKKPRWTPYFLPAIVWIYSRNNQISCFPFFWHPALCIYLYPVTQPSDLRAIWDWGHQTIREIISKRIRLLNWWLLN